MRLKLQSHLTNQGGQEGGNATYFCFLFRDFFPYFFLKKKYVICLSFIIYYHDHFSDFFIFYFPSLLESIYAL